MIALLVAPTPCAARFRERPPSAEVGKVLFRNLDTSRVLVHASCGGAWPIVTPLKLSQWAQAAESQQPPGIPGRRP
jgi:hypothetical protein